jgi:hypothetical protein
MIKKHSAILLSAMLALPMFASGAQIINGSSCTLKYRGNNNQGMTTVYPAVIVPTGSGLFDFRFPTGFFSSFNLEMVYDIHCEDQDVADGGSLVIYNYSDDTRSVGACAISDQVKLYPGRSPRINKTCGQLTEKEIGYVLKLKNK